MRGVEALETVFARYLPQLVVAVVRGLPTLRAFNRGEEQAERIEQVSDRYRRAAMGTLRIAFPSETVFELATTLGVAPLADRVVASAASTRARDSTLDALVSNTEAATEEAAGCPFSDARGGIGHAGWGLCGRTVSLFRDVGIRVALGANGFLALGGTRGSRDTIVPRS